VDRRQAMPAFVAVVDCAGVAGVLGEDQIYPHPSKPDRVTVPGKPNDDLAPGTLNSILKQAGLRK
jgi:hypothetical protein